MRAAVERAVAHVAADIAERLAGVAGVTASVAGGDIVVRGRRLAARWIDDARLRWIAR